MLVCGRQGAYDFLSVCANPWPAPEMLKIMWFQSLAGRSCLSTVQTLSVSLTFYCADISVNFYHN